MGLGVTYRAIADGSEFGATRDGGRVERGFGRRCDRLDRRMVGDRRTGHATQREHAETGEQDRTAPQGRRVL